MADDVSVRFGGDSSGIAAAAAQAKAAVQQQAQATRAANADAAAAFRLLAVEMRAAREAAVAQALAAEQTATSTGRLAAATREASDWQTDLKAKLEATTLGYVAVKLAAHEYAVTLAEIDAARGVVNGASDSIAQMASTAQAGASAIRSYYTETAYASRESRLFAQANDGMRASIGQVILGLETYVERLQIAGTETARNELAAIAAAGGLERFKQAVAASGEGAKSVLVGFTAELEKIPNTSREAAASIEAMLATVPNYSVDTNNILVNLIQSISKTGDEAVANAKKITTAFTDDKNGGKILGDLTGDLKNLEDIQVLATRVGASLTPTQATAYFDTIIAKLRSQSALQQTIVDQDNAALTKLPLMGGAIASIYERWTQAAQKQREYAADISVATANLETQKNAVEAILRAQQQQVDFQKALNAETTQTTRQEQAEASIASLRSRQTRSVAPAGGSERDLLIRTIYGEAGNQGTEGQEAVANVIRNRAISSYNGAQSYSDVVQQPRQFSVWNDGDRAGDMARGLSPDSDVYRRLGEIVDRVTAGQSTDPTRGATSYYNPAVASPSWGNTLSNRTTIGAHDFGNTPNSPPVASAADQERITQRLQEQGDAVRRIAEERRGGTEADVASLDIAQKGLTTARDEVAEAQKLVEARQKDVAAAANGTPAARLSAERALADARQTLRDRETAQEKSAVALQVASMEAGSREKLRIQNDALTQEQAGYAKGSAQWNRLHAEKETNERATNQAIATERAATEDASYARARAVLDQRLSDLKDESRVHGVTAQERLQIASEINAQILALDRQHQQARAAIWAEDPAKYRQAQAQLVQIDIEAAQRQARARSDALRAEYQETARTYEQIGSTITSNTFSVIQGQSTIGQAAKNTAMSIIQSYAQAKVKMVADWLAGVATHTTGEATKTAATVGGVAVRTGAEEAGATASLATQAGAMLKSIGASAAETFAGIFGFLSPILGPAAVGPAAAGEATVAAAASAVGASLAIGSWGLPSDTVAQLHEGEMVIPRSQAADVRSLIMGSDPSQMGGGGGGGSTHNWNIQALDAASVVALFRKHGSAIAGVVSGQMGANPSLRPVY